MLPGHTETVEAVAVSPDGRYIATGCFDKNVRLFEAATGKEVRTFGGEQGHKGQVLCLAFSAKGDQLASGGADRRVLVWDVPVRSPVKSYPLDAPGTSVAVSNDGKSFALASADGTARVYPQGDEKRTVVLKGPKSAVVGMTPLGNSGWVTANADQALHFFAADGKETARYHTGAAITGLVARRDGGAIFTTSADGTLRFWQMPSRVAKSFPALKEAVTAFASSTDGNTLLIATADKLVTLGAANNATIAGTFRGAKGNVESVALAPDNNTIAAGVADGTLILWNRQGNVIAELPAHPGGTTAMAFHPSQPILFTAGADGVVKGWNLPIDPKKKEKDKSGKEKPVKLTRYAWKAHTGKVTALLVNSASGQVATAGTDKRIRLWDVSKTEKPVREIGPLPSTPVTLTLSRDNQTLAAGVGKEVRLWALANGKEAGKLPQSGDVLALSFSADKTRLAIGRSDNTAVLAEVATANVMQAFPHTGPVRGVVAHPDGQTIITASVDKSVVVSPITCTRVIAIGAGKPGLAVTPGGERVVTFGTGKEAVSWNSGNGQKEKTFASGGTATAATISKDGQRLAVGGSDGSIHVYTINDAKRIGSIAAGAEILDLDFQPTNTVLVSLLKEKENRATAWNVTFQPGQPVPPEFGEKLQSYPQPTASTGLAFTADGEFLTACVDKQVRRYRVASSRPKMRFDLPNLVDSVAFDDSGDKLATGCHDGLLRIYDLTKKSLLKQVEAHIIKTPRQVQNPIYCVLWSTDHKQVFTSSFDSSIKLWNASSGALVREFKAAPEPKAGDTKGGKPPATPELVGHRDQVFSMALSKDGKYLASGSSDRSVKLWDVATGKVLRDFPNPDLKPIFPGEAAPSQPGWVHAVRFSPDGSRIISAGAAPRGRSYIAVWNSADGKRLSGAESEFGPIHAMAILDEARIVIGWAGVPRKRVESGAAILRVMGK